MPRSLTLAALLLAGCAAAAEGPGRTGAPAPAAACAPTGCSGQVCSDAPVVTTCEWKPEYGCYRGATCARGSDGKCGWVLEPTLRECLERARRSRPRDEPPVE